MSHRCVLSDIHVTGELPITTEDGRYYITRFQYHEPSSVVLQDTESDNPDANETHDNEPPRKRPLVGMCFVE